MGWPSIVTPGLTKIIWFIGWSKKPSTDNCMHKHVQVYARMNARARDGELPLFEGQSRLKKSIKYTTQQTPVCSYYINSKKYCLTIKFK